MQIRPYNRRKTVIVAGLIVLVFTAVLLWYYHESNSRPKQMTQEEINAIPKADDRYKYSVDSAAVDDDGRLSIKGFAYKEGEETTRINIRVVLHRKADNSYYTLPTGYEENVGINAVATDGIDHTNDGVTSIFPASHLHGDFEILYLYRNNGDNVQIETGKEVSL